MTWQHLLVSLAGLLLLFAGLIGTVQPVGELTTPERIVGDPPSLPTVSPTAAPSWPRSASLNEAEQARRNGDHDGAQAVLRLLLAQADAAMANEALLQLGVVLVEDGRGPEGAEAARDLLRRQPEPAMQARATFVLGRAQRTAGDCAAAIASFSEAQRLGLDVGPYVDLQAAECYARLEDRAGQADRAAKAVAGATASQARVDAMEHLVDAALKRSDAQAALLASEPLLAAAPTREYRARTLASIANIDLRLGRRDEATQAFATVVAELPETAAAPGALEALASLDALGLAGPDQAGLVYYFRGRHADAVAALADGLSQGLGDERAARALYYQGLSLLRLDRVDEGVESLRRAARVMPNAAASTPPELAPQALLRAGRALESSGRLTQAEEVYRQAYDGYPGLAAGQEAQQRLVFSLLLRDALPESVATARELVASDAAGRWKGLGLLWAGKAFARAGDSAQAEAAWRQAADLDQDDFGGIRAAAILAGDPRAVPATGAFDPARLQPSQVDRAELADWLAQHGASAQALLAEQMTDSNYVRAAELFRLGLREQGRWELQEVAVRVGKNPARLYWLAQFSADRGEPQLGIRFAVAARQATGEPFHTQPRLLQRVSFPLPYAELILSHAQRRGMDPLLFAALVRQESTFNPTARSSANALGLAQVVPATGRDIARQLGHADFKTEDLLRPVVSVEFGMYYLANQLEAYQGLIFPALAAYNAGPRAASAWLREFGADDVDVFAERIPYPETNRYVQVVYEYYRVYRRLYAG